MKEITKQARQDIAEILHRRANEIAGYLDAYRRRDNYFGSVELALSREIERLRDLAVSLEPEEEVDTE